MRALLLLGCPEVPVQTGLALYLGSTLKDQGFTVIAAGTPSAVSLMRTADPKKAYIDAYIDIDRCIDQMAEGTFDVDIAFGFIHKDSGMQYLGTIAALSPSTPVAIVFGRDAEALSGEVSESIEGAHVVWAKAVHNPLPLKKKIDKIGPWASLVKS
ncbi:MAG: DUF1890 family protein [Halobacteriota archaeon]